MKIGLNIEVLKPTRIRMPKLKRWFLRQAVPNSCPDKREHVNAALKAGEAPWDCRHDGVMHDSRVPRWYAAPKGRHQRAMPRWGGMNLTPNGKVTSRMATDDELDEHVDLDTIHDLDYASKPITWGGR
jgi:hypothetical protein